MNQVKDKVALITGGASGIGAATASLLKEEGATVVIADLASSNGEKTAEQQQWLFCALDIRKEDDWASCMDEIAQKFGRLDILVNCAGTEGEMLSGSLDEMSLSAWREVISINLDGTFLGCRAALQQMHAAKTGSIINVSSIGAYYPTHQSPAYGASKAGMTQLTKSVAIQGSVDGGRIRCNSVHPGMIKTPMLDRVLGALSQHSVDEYKLPEDDSKSSIPFGAGSPDDVAQLILFLASDGSRYITGTEFLIDGGWSLMK